jgi:predicted XRE-type DNA-binding protein
MKASDRFKTLLDRYEKDPGFVAEGILIDINEQIVRLMEQQQMNKTTLARKLEVSNAYVSKLLGGNQNLTIRQLVKVVMVLESRLDVAVVPKDADVHRMFRYVSKKIDPKELMKSVTFEESHESDCPAAA